MSYGKVNKSTGERIPYASNRINTTYSLSAGTGADANKIILTPSSGNPDKVTVPYATSAGNANTVNSHTVASDVPANAVFTDNNTTYGLSVGTGTDANKIVLTPSSGTADKITVPYSTNAGTVNGKTVAANVPSDAKFTDTTYTFANGTNGFTVTPLGGTAQNVTVTPNIVDNVTGSGTSGYIAKFNGGNTITNGPAIGSDTTKYLRNDGTWAVPPDTVYSEGLGIQISGSIINNDGVRSIAEGTTIGTINVNTGGTTADVAVKGLKASAYKAFDTEVTQGSSNLITSGAVKGAIDDLYNVSTATLTGQTGVTITKQSLKKSVNTVTLLALVRKVMTLDENNLLFILPAGYRPTEQIVTCAFNDTKMSPIRMQISPTSGGVYVMPTAATSDAAAQDIWIALSYIAS